MRQIKTAKLGQAIIVVNSDNGAFVFDVPARNKFF